MEGIISTVITLLPTPHTLFTSPKVLCYDARQHGSVRMLRQKLLAEKAARRRDHTPNVLINAVIAPTSSIKYPCIPRDISRARQQYFDEGGPSAIPEQAAFCRRHPKYVVKNFHLGLVQPEIYLPDNVKRISAILRVCRHGTTSISYRIAVQRI